MAEVTQLGTTSQSLTLTGTAILDLEPSCIWNGNVSISAPRVFL
ncbi:hypothetical protein N9242_02385 [Vicingaceae bacterium]|nr:hypothetical protein [Vicingaceae bacterium]